MCGIFGLIVAPRANLNMKRSRQTVDRLFVLSESRGKEAAGLAFLGDEKIDILKMPQPASVLIKSKEYKNLWRVAERQRDTFALIGHARLVTNGSQVFNKNNQPVIKEGLVAVHNGIVTNVEELWLKFDQLKKETGVDTEVILALINKFLAEGEKTVDVLVKVYNLIEGMASLAFFSATENKFFLSTNNGSLYYCYHQDRGILVFASEKYILKKIIKKNLGDVFDLKDIKHLESKTGLVIDLARVEGNNFSFSSPEDKIVDGNRKRRNINLVSLPEMVVATEEQVGEVPADFFSLVEERQKEIQNLRRCTKCILPETFPFIEFDEDGICNYCHNYQKIKIKGEEELKIIADKYRRSDGKADCLMTFSGGRDSSFCLHYVKNVLKLNPVAYSYDWGMITDLGRRNQARMCGRLGVEHILISADIRKKRENIRKNVLAWLKKPDLGTVPLFMAGDKQYFYYANKLKKLLKIDLIIIGTNFLEKTYFKAAFGGAKIKFKSQRPYSLSFINKMRLGLYYLKSFIINPAYFNSSLIDTFTGFLSFYFISHKYLNIYDYLPWDEKEIETVLKEKYNWEISSDTKTTWRIGDGTASFYNYIYYMVTGFTENDTFRSNQIREGNITREDALRRSREDNQIRWESIQWYCQTVGIDFEKTIRTINEIKKLY
jgi:predicted glutamine amidotransferase